MRQFHKPYKPRIASPKDFDHFKSNVLGASPVTSLPRELLFLTPILNQGAAPSCTAYTAVAIRQSMTGKTYDPEKQWAEELQFIGDPNAAGVELKTQLAVGVKMGFVPLGQTTPIDAATAYFFVQKASGLDWFDSLRVCMNQIQGPLSIGVNWFNEWDRTPNGIIPETKPTFLLGGHDTKVAGFQNYNGVDYIVLQGSWGPTFGDQGLFRASRSVINNYFVAFGAGYWTDDQNPQIKKLGWLAALLTNLVALYQTLIARKQTTIPEPIKPPSQPTTYFWDTKDNARHSVRVICDETGLPLNDKNILTACVQVESDFDPNAIHHNRDIDGKITSTDYGIAQINDFFHIGPGKDFPSVQFVLENPEACIRWMAKMWKAGKQSLWTSFSTGAYKQYLKVANPN
jgi:hypothetical protein